MNFYSHPQEGFMPFKAVKYNEQDLLLNIDKNQNITAVNIENFVFTARIDNHEAQWTGQLLESVKDDPTLCGNFYETVITPIMKQIPDSIEKQRAKFYLDDYAGQQFYETAEKEYLTQWQGTHKKLIKIKLKQREIFKQSACYCLRQFIAENFNLPLPQWHQTTSHW
ncbi:MAG: hypothetical protein ACI8QY_000881 [bacterium]|jgi:hypothetical protein